MFFFDLLIKLILSPGIFPLKIQILPLNKLCIKGEINHARNRYSKKNRRPRTCRYTQGDKADTQDTRGRPVTDNTSQDYRFVSAMKEIAERLHIGK